MPCDLFRCELPLVRPLATARGTISARTLWVVALSDGAGHTGLGEAAPLPGFGGEDPAACDRVLNQAILKLTPELVGRWLERGRADAPLGMQLEQLLASFPCARHAIEGALVDLLAQSRDLPVAGALNDSAAVRVPVNALATDDAGAAEAAAAGYGTIKLKAPADPLAAADLALAARKAVGAAARLRVDANGAWNPEQALAFAQAAREAHLEYLEQPLPAADLEAMAQLRRQTGMVLAVDESVRSAADVGRVGATQAAAVVVLKPMFLGGWRGTLQAVQLAKGCGLEVVLSSTIESGIGRAYATHLAAAANLCVRANGLATGHLLAADLVSEPLVPRQGHLLVRERPGLGIGTLAG